MSNNICLSHQDQHIEPLDHYNPQTSVAESPIQSSFKESNLFIKSQVSIADTTCDDNSPICHKFQDNAIHQHSFSLTEFNLEDSPSPNDDDYFCNQFSERGYCMRGNQCTKIHQKNVGNCDQSQERASLLVTLFKQMPEILILCQKRKAYFGK